MTRQWRDMQVGKTVGIHRRTNEEASKTNKLVELFESRLLR